MNTIILDDKGIQLLEGVIATARHYCREQLVKDRELSKTVDRFVTQDQIASQETFIDEIQELLSNIKSQI